MDDTFVSKHTLTCGTFAKLNPFSATQPFLNFLFFMKNYKNLLLTLLTIFSLGLTSCLHIVEEVTFNNKGNGSYKMNLDMSEVKGMMEMFKGMDTDSTAVEGAEGEVAAEEDNSMAQMGTEISGVAGTLKTIQGVTNIVEINDTTAFQFGYSFDFNSVETLNKALKVINKEKYDSKVEEIYIFNGKSFERKAQGDMGEEIKKALAEGDDEAGEESMDMVKMFFADMTYKQVYHFPDRQVKKSSNGLSELSDDDHTLTITLKPFDEEQLKSKANVRTEVKLK